MGWPVIGSRSMRLRRISRSIRLTASILPKTHSSLGADRLGTEEHRYIRSVRSTTRPNSSSEVVPSSTASQAVFGQGRETPLLRPGTNFVHGGAAGDQFVDTLHRYGAVP